MKDLRALTPAKEEEAIHEVLAGFERMYASKQTYATALGWDAGLAEAFSRTKNARQAVKTSLREFGFPEAECIRFGDASP